MSPTSSEVARHYATFQVQTASHPKRISMLHVRCVELIMLGRQEDDAAKRRIFLDKAQNILSQFQGVLHVDDAVSQGLFFLYDYTYMLLEHGREEDVAHSLEIMVTLRNTFEELLRSI